MLILAFIDFLRILNSHRHMVTAAQDIIDIYVTDQFFLTC